MLVRFLGDTSLHKIGPVCSSVLLLWSRGRMNHEPASNAMITFRLDIHTATWEIIKGSKTAPSPLIQLQIVNRTLCVHFSLRSEGLAQPMWVSLFSLSGQMTWLPSQTRAGASRQPGDRSEDTSAEDGGRAPRQLSRVLPPSTLRAGWTGLESGQAPPQEFTPYL